MPTNFFPFSKSDKSMLTNFFFLKTTVQATDRRSIKLWNFFDTSSADPFILKVYDVIGISAENTAGAVFFEDYFVTLDKYFKRIFGVYVECGADLHRNNDSTEVVDGSYDTGRFHKNSPLLFFLIISQDGEIVNGNL